ncbi:MAG TPA: TRAP transporter small permease subunit [Burkholderiales bacterium]|nr:TRAP transporter small permease subunit [Burkholderiales bacterium]
MTLRTLRSAFERLMEWIVIVLMVALSAEVTLGIVYRTLGRSLVWYDEVAAILLAWLTFYGSALAALKRAHIGFPGLVNSLPPVWRVPAVAFAEICVVAFFVLLGWMGYSILAVLDTDYLVSLPEVRVAWTQSVIPIGSALYVIAELLSLPSLLAAAKGRGPLASSDLAEKLH